MHGLIGKMTTLEGQRRQRRIAEGVVVRETRRLLEIDILGPAAYL